jgi:peptidase E
MGTFIAMGGGGFSDGVRDLRLERYLLSVTGGDDPTVCFLPTASGDAPDYITGFYDCFGRLPCRPRHLGLFPRTVEDLRAPLLDCDLLLIGGGSTVNLRAVLAEHGADEILRERFAAKAAIAGLSAGALLFFAGGVTSSFGGADVFDAGYGLLPGSFCPHWSSQTDRRAPFREAVARGALPPGLAADDGVAIRFDDGALAEVVSVRAGAGAVRVGDGEEAALEVRALP